MSVRGVTEALLLPFLTTPWCAVTSADDEFYMVLLVACVRQRQKYSAQFPINNKALRSIRNKVWIDRRIVDGSEGKIEGVREEGSWTNRGKEESKDVKRKLDG